MKGIYNKRPPEPKYNQVWNIDIVLEYLKAYKHVKDLSLKDLTLKLVSLIALSTAARVDTLCKLSIKELIEDKDFILLTVDAPLKHNRVGNKLGTVKI